MEPHLDPVAAMNVPSAFPVVTALAMDLVRRQPGAQHALIEMARSEPEEVALSLVALGAVLLDISAEAFRLTIEEMFDKVAEGIMRMSDDDAGG